MDAAAIAKPGQENIFGLGKENWQNFNDDSCGLFACYFFYDSTECRPVAWTN
jgi:hypothetical protein